MFFIFPIFFPWYGLPGHHLVSCSVAGAKELSLGFRTRLKGHWESWASPPSRSSLHCSFAMPANWHIAVRLRSKPCMVFPCPILPPSISLDTSWLWTQPLRNPGAQPALTLSSFSVASSPVWGGSWLCLRRVFWWKLIQWSLMTPFCKVAKLMHPVGSHCAGNFHSGRTWGWLLGSK